MTRHNVIAWVGCTVLCAIALFAVGAGLSLIVKGFIMLWGVML